MKTRSFVNVPVQRPFTRTPIQPVRRHVDRKNDFKRQPKHRRPS